MQNANLTTAIIILSLFKRRCYSSIYVGLFYSSSDGGWITGPTLTLLLESRGVFTTEGGEKIQFMDTGQGEMDKGFI